jgi:hypothetical protein
MSPFCYAAYGLTIQAELPLPELFPTLPGSGPDVVVRIGPVSPLPDDQSGSAYCSHWLGAEAFYAVPHVGRVAARRGVELVIDPEPGASQAAMSLFACGVGLATLMHQRGLLVLHGSGVARCAAGESEGVLLFLGQKGSGKSTTAAALVPAGFDLLFDDVAPVAVDDPPRTWRGYPELKLWPDVVESLAVAPDELPRLVHYSEKRRHRLGPTARAGEDGKRLSPSAVGIDAVYVIACGTPLAVVDLEAADACMALVQQSFFLRQIVKEESDRERHLDQCAALARATRVKRLQLPRDLAQLPQLVELLQRDRA